MCTPKSLLRHPLARSPVEDFLSGTSLKRIIEEDGKASEDPSKVERLVFCTGLCLISIHGVFLEFPGKVYYDIIADRKKAGLDEKIAVTRVEQLAPFPYDLIDKECGKYANAELIWAQEVGWLWWLLLIICIVRILIRSTRTWARGPSSSLGSCPC